MSIIQFFFITILFLINVHSQHRHHATIVSKHNPYYSKHPLHRYHHFKVYPNDIKPKRRFKPPQSIRLKTAPRSYSDYSQYSAHQLHMLYRLLSHYSDNADKRDGSLRWGQQQQREPPVSVHNKEHEALADGDQSIINDMLTEQKQQIDTIHESCKNHEIMLNIVKSTLASSSSKTGVDLTTNVKEGDEEDMIELSGPMVDFLVRAYNETNKVITNPLLRTLTNGVHIVGKGLKAPVIMINRQFIRHAMTLITKLMTNYIGGAVLLFEEKFNAKFSALNESIINYTRSNPDKVKRMMPLSGIRAWFGNRMAEFLQLILSAVEKTSRLVFGGFIKIFKMVMVFGVRKFQEITARKFEVDFEPYTYTDKAFEELRQQQHHDVSDEEKANWKHWIMKRGDDMKKWAEKPFNQKAFNIAVKFANEAMLFGECCVHEFLEKRGIERINAMCQKAPIYKKWLNDKMEAFFKSFVNLAIKISKAIFNHAKEAIAKGKGIEYDKELLNVARIEYKNRLNDLFG